MVCGPCPSLPVTAFTWSQISCAAAYASSPLPFQLDAERLPSMEQLLGQHVDLSRVQKIGEGTFGEAFKAGGVVFKIVPMEGQLLVSKGVPGGSNCGAGAAERKHGPVHAGINPGPAGSFCFGWALPVPVPWLACNGRQSASPVLLPQVNGEVQKRAEEIVAEAAITLTLSRLRGPTGGQCQKGFNNRTLKAIQLWEAIACCPTAGCELL